MNGQGCALQGSQARPGSSIDRTNSRQDWLVKAGLCLTHLTMQEIDWIGMEAAGIGWDAWLGRGETGTRKNKQWFGSI